MLMDKGYYDYDYAEVEKKEQDEIRASRSDTEMQDIFKRCGWGKVKTLKDKGDNSAAASKSVENIQAAAMQKIQNDKQKNNG